MEIYIQRMGCDQRLVAAASQQALKDGVVEASNGRPDKIIVISNMGYTKKKLEATLIALMPLDRVSACKVGFQLHPGNVQAMATRCIRVSVSDSGTLEGDYHFVDYYTHKAEQFERRISDFSNEELLHKAVADFMLHGIVPAV